MDTFFAKNRLSAYLDGALPEREAADVAAAIERDPELKAEYDALRAAVAALRQHGPVAAPEGFRARVMGAVEQEPSQRGVVVQLRRMFTQVPLEAMAVAAAALLVVFAAVSQMKAPTPAVAPAPQPPATPELAVVPAAPPVESKEAEAPSEDVRPASATPAQPAPERAEPTAQARKNSISPKAATPAATEGAYVPEWEAAKTASDPSFGGTEGLSITVTDPDVLQKLYVLTERAGGRMLDQASQPLRPYGLSTRDPIARVLLLVPVDRAETLRGQLVRLGAVATPPPSSAPTLAAGYSGFFVEARLLD